MLDGIEQDVLVCNAGSSSLKLACYDMAKGPHQKAKAVASISGTAEELLKALKDYLLKEFPRNTVNKKPLHVLHRIVHAGRQSEGAIAIDAQLLKTITHWQVLAPLHNRLALSIISTVSKHFPDCKQFAVFDSGLYADLPALAKFYALPEHLSNQWPIERYGFHGLAHRCLWKNLQAHASYKRVISLQLGSGCSATAWLDGKVLDTSMGFTPLEGLSMATRSGSIDPGILVHLLDQENYSLEQLEQVLNKQSGLLGLSYSSKDVVKVLNSNETQCQFSVDHFCYQAVKMIGAYTFVLGGLDAICFGGGIVEHNPHVLEKILAYLVFMGFVPSETDTQQYQLLRPLHAPDSKLQAWLISIDEMQEMFEQYCLHKTQ